MAIRRRVGYLPGELSLGEAQTTRQVLDHLGSLRGGIDPTYRDELLERFDVEPDRKIKDLSTGNKQKVGIIQAFMHRPEVLILDEPTAGLDPLMQQEFTVMARQVVAEGRTVFMSSHVMGEVQRTSDRVGLIRDGTLVAEQSVESLRASSVRRVEIEFAGPVPREEFARLPGVSSVDVDGSVLRCRLDGPADALVKAAAARTVLSLTSEEPDLEDVFLERYSAQGGTP